MNRRKKILIHSNSHTAFTGFGKNCKNILKYLYSTGKYELYELANGVIHNNNTNNFPWKIFGGVPNDQNIIHRMNTDPNFARLGTYGLYMIDQAISEIKPDVYIGIEDIWAFSETVKKPWWNKMNCMIWTTLDSLPILPEAISMASKIKNYYCWSSFAEKAMRNIGINHVKTLHGSIDEKNFYKLDDNLKLNLRNKFGIDKDTYIIGYVFRNQLRKTVADLISAFRLLKSKNQEKDIKLLLHTNWSEGWNIVRFMQENGVSQDDILTTYHCQKCKNYHIMPFSGQELTCAYCKTQKSFSTTSVINGVSEIQLNEIYNLMNLYVHPFTSGGQEIPIQEAKLTELVTLVTNYSCGEEMCSEESGGFPLSWFPYREIGTQFIKASTNPIDIYEKISSIMQMPSEQIQQLGKNARNYIISNYSYKSIGQKLESIIDEMPILEYSLEESNKPNPNWNPNSVYKSDIDFVIDLYKNVLGATVDSNDDGLKHWISRLRNGENVNNVINYFKSVALNELSKNNITKIEDVIDKNDKSQRIAFVIPSDSFIGLTCSYFIKNIKEKYPDYKLYVFADKQIHHLFYPYSNIIHKLCPKFENCENQSFMEGIGNNDGLFDICFILNKNELNSSIYSHNDKG